MTVTQADKALQFRGLHEAPDAFVIANVWDGGSARMMAGLGFAALATSSGASAGLLGRRDGRVTRDAVTGTIQAVSRFAAQEPGSSAPPGVAVPGSATPAGALNATSAGSPPTSATSTRSSSPTRCSRTSPSPTPSPTACGSAGRAAGSDG